jgi:hypothetical protein
MGKAASGVFHIMFQDTSASRRSVGRITYSQGIGAEFCQYLVSGQRGSFSDPQSAVVTISQLIDGSPF